MFCSVIGLVCFLGFTASALTGVLNSIKFDLLLLVVLLELPLGFAVWFFENVIKSKFIFSNPIEPKISFKALLDGLCLRNLCTLSSCPMDILLIFFKLLSLAICSTVVPFLFAILSKVSPCFTIYLTSEFTLSCCPIDILSLSFKLLSLAICSTVVPFLFAIFSKVSPFLTT
ncbi:hypothetical protein D3C72_843720 [compost metagenome]